MMLNFRRFIHAKLNDASDSPSVELWEKFPTYLLSLRLWESSDLKGPGKLRLLRIIAQARFGYSHTHT